MDILNKIYKLLAEKNWTQYKLANEAGLSQSALSNMFSRKTLPSITTLSNICDAFGITLSEFFEEENINREYTIEEKLLISDFRELSDNERIAILNLTKQLARK